MIILSLKYQRENALHGVSNVIPTKISTNQ